MIRKNREAGSSGGTVVMTEGTIWRQMVLFILPIIFGSFFQQLYNTTDAIIMGRFVGKAALAAVGGATATIINLLVGFFTGLASGGAVVIAQYYGAKWGDRLQKAIHTAMALGIVGGAVLTAAGILIAPWALAKMGTPEDMIGYAVTYMRIYFIGCIPNILYNIGAGILRALGDSRHPLYILIACCGVNIVFDILFVAVFRMEAAGAGLATILSQLFSCIGVLFCLIKHGDPSCRLHIGKIPAADLGELGRIVRIGLPAGFQSSLYSISNILIQSTINSFGTDTVAAWTVYGKLESIYWMIIGAFGIAITTFVGQNYGAQKIERIKKGVIIAWGMSMAVSAAVVAVFLTCGNFVFTWYSDDPTVLSLCSEYLHLIPPLLLTFNTIEILSGAVRGVGDSAAPTVITLVGVCALRIIWIFTVVPIYRSMTTVALSYPLTWTITSLVFFIYYKSGGWLKRAQRRKT